MCEPSSSDPGQHTRPWDRGQTGHNVRNAFDTVPQAKLMTKMRQCGVGGDVWDWIEPWLTNQTQQVVLDREKSERVHVISGLPQGQVLVPLLFVLCNNNIGEEVDFSQLCSLAYGSLLYRVCDHRIEWVQQ